MVKVHSCGAESQDLPLLQVCLPASSLAENLLYISCMISMTADVVCVCVFQNRGDGLDMNVYPVWVQGYTGRDVVVSILDDGIEKDHPDIKKNYVCITDSLYLLLATLLHLQTLVTVHLYCTCLFPSSWLRVGDYFVHHRSPLLPVSLVNRDHFSTVLFVV